MIAHCSICCDKDQMIADLQASLIEPGFALPVAGETLRQIREVSRRDDSERYDMYRADVDDLKGLNTATGSQLRSDELLRPAWTVRRGDMVLAGKTDAGDGLAFIFSAGQGARAIERIQADLRNAPMTIEEHRRFVLAVCRKRYGPTIGWLRYGLYRLGWWMRDHPSLTIAAYENVPATELEQIFFEDQQLFQAKASGRRGEVLR